jgi:hypothetical protein
MLRSPHFKPRLIFFAESYEVDVETILSFAESDEKSLYDAIYRMIIAPHVGLHLLKMR